MSKTILLPLIMFAPFTAMAANPDTTDFDKCYSKAMIENNTEIQFNNKKSLFLLMLKTCPEVFHDIANNIQDYDSYNISLPILNNNFVPIALALSNSQVDIIEIDVKPDISQLLTDKNGVYVFKLTDAPASCTNNITITRTKGTWTNFIGSASQYVDQDGYYHNANLPLAIACRNIFDTNRQTLGCYAPNNYITRIYSTTDIDVTKNLRYTSSDTSPHYARALFSSTLQHALIQAYGLKHNLDGKCGSASITVQKVNTRPHETKISGNDFHYFRDKDGFGHDDWWAIRLFPERYEYKPNQPTRMFTIQTDD